MKPGPKPSPLEERFWRRATKGDPDECWEWEGSTKGNPYGEIRADGKVVNAHRASYMIHKGDPGDKFVLHDCDNQPCVNPAHLHLGTHADNMQEAWDRGSRDTTGEKNPPAKLTADEVEEIKSKLGEKTHKELGSEYDVSASTISMISVGENWSHIEAGNDD